MIDANDGAGSVYTVRNTRVGGVYDERVLTDDEALLRYIV